VSGLRIRALSLAIASGLYSSAAQPAEAEALEAAGEPPGSPQAPTAAPTPHEGAATAEAGA
jgi:hypothetical protein